MTSKPNILLALDLSTSATGYSVWNLDTGALVEYGSVVKKASKAISSYPWSSLKSILWMADEVVAVIEKYQPTHIVAEEICRHVSRLSGKVLDSLHFILLYKLLMKDLPKTFKWAYIDVSRWRKVLNIRLSEQDKLLNADRRKMNKKTKKGTKKLHLIDWKDLACRYVNANFPLNLDAASTASDGDVADSICIGIAHLKDLGVA